MDLQKAEQVGAPYWPGLCQSGLPGFFPVTSGSTVNVQNKIEKKTTIIFKHKTSGCNKRCVCLLPDSPSEAEHLPSCRLRPVAQRTPASSRQPPSPWLPQPSGHQSGPGGHSAFITRGEGNSGVRGGTINARWRPDVPDGINQLPLTLTLECRDTSATRVVFFVVVVFAYCTNRLLEEMQRSQTGRSTERLF